MLALAAGDETGYAERLGRALATPLPDWFALLDRREHLFRAWREFFKQLDILLCPVAMVVAFPHDTKGQGTHAEQLERRLLVSGEARPYFDNFAWPGIATCANLPATVIPTGRPVDGLPAGVQAIGPYLEDRTTLRFAQLVEQHRLASFTPPPQIRS
jgi:amidase